VPPETRFARLGGDRIAYQVLGEGPPDLLLARRSYGHIDVAWEDPGISLFLRRLASFCRLVLFNRRGTGPSDPLPLDSLPPWESFAEELEALLNEVGCERAAVMAEMDAGPTALLFAGTRPERTSALVLVHTSARFVAGSDYPIGGTPETVEALVAQFDELWGSEAMAALLVPSRAGDARFASWFAKWQRAGASPRVAQRLLRTLAEIDVRPVLPLVQAPTLILHRRGFGLVPIAHARYLADHIRGARLLELPGSDVDLTWETPELALDGIQELLTGARRDAEPGRVLATVLFTDIVGSTELAARAGDRRWREVLEVHDELAGRLVAQFHGQLVKTTGDGILATFDGPGRAIRCAAALGEGLTGIGLAIRAGLHTGEIELRDDDVGGIAVHIAARVLAAAGPGQIVASRTVRDLVVGSGIGMDDLGTHQLKGVDGAWQLFAARP
jgi:class 3 adenylate cyclase